MEYRFYLYHQDLSHYRRIKDPVGWDGLAKTIRRFGIEGTVGLRWHGLFFEYNPRLQFIKDGKQVVQFFYEKYGIEQDLLLRIEKRDPLTRKFEYEYEGRLNLHSYKVTTTTVECNIEQTGFIQKLKNRQDLPVDLTSLVSQGGKAITPFTNETRTITLHSRALRKDCRDAAGTRASDFVVLGTGKTYMIFDMEPVVDEIEERFDYPMQFSTFSPLAVYKYMYKISEGGSFSFKFKITWFVDSFNVAETMSGTQKWFIVTGTPAGYTTTQLGSTVNFTGQYAITGSVDVTHSVTLAAGDEVYIYGELDLSAVSGDFNWRYRVVTEGDVLFTADTTTPATTAKVQLAHEVWTRVLQSITDTADPFYSDYYGRTDSEKVTYGSDGAGSLRCVTNGFQIRGIDRPIQCTLKQLVDTFLAVDGIGLGIEKSNGVERVRVEPLTYWYQSKRLMRLDYVKDIEKEVAQDLFYNLAEGGSEKWVNEKKGNLDEFNGPRKWALPITQVKKTLQLQSLYNLCGQSIEITRRDRLESNKDSRYDNDNFVIQLRRNAGFEPDKNQDFATVTGIIDAATAYNLKLSPARNLRRNGRLLRTGLHKQTDGQIRFGSGEGNLSLVSRLSSEATAITENADIDIDTLDSPLFLPEIYSFRAKLTREQLVALNTTDPAAAENVFGYIEFSGTDGDYKRGYVLEAQPAADSNEVQFRLLRANV